MARDYANVLRALSRPFTVIGRGEERVRALAAEFSAPYAHGGLDKAVRDAATKPSHAIVALPVDALHDAACALLPHCEAILLEKPGALEAGEITDLVERRVPAGRAKVFVAYNRRFLPSIAELRARIAAEGPVLSAVLEFDEPIPRIEALPTDPAIKARWGYANASHVFDLLWHLCGPSVEEFHVAGGAGTPSPELAWHPAGAVYAGAGRTESGTRYVYHGNYASVGRWRLTLSVARKRYILCPLEALRVVEGGSVAEQEVALPQNAFPALKPGLREQVEAFLDGDPQGILATARYQAWHMRHLAHLFGYPL